MKTLLFSPFRRNIWFYIIFDSADAFRHLGHQVHIFEVSGSQEESKRVYEVMNEFKPDLLFTANNVGLTNEFISKTTIPVVSWLTLEPSILLKFLPSEKYYLFICGASYVDRLKLEGYSNVYYLPLATNPNVFKEITLNREEIEKYGCDLSFAGGCNYDIWYSKYKEGIDRLFTEEAVKKIIECQSRDLSRSIIDVFIEVQKDNLQGSSLIEEEYLKRYLESKYGEEFIALRWAAKAMHRKRVIKILSGFGVQLYGDEGWEEVMEFPGVEFHPLIEDRCLLAKLYNATEVNLNLLTTASLNLTTFNIPACGAFMISNFSKELVSLFREGEEVVCFRRAEELPEMVKYYLGRPKVRKEIASNARKRVLNEHTFVHRMKRLIQIMESQ